MALLSIVENVRYWILAGVICAFLIGSIGDITSTILILVLIIQMSLSMDGLVLRKKDISDNSKEIIWSAVFCFVICSGSALLMGLLFKGAYPEIWNGWVMLASVPCAVSVITFALYLKGDMVLSVLATTVIYFMALVITPVMTMVFAGDAISPLQILKYVVLFIVVPLAMTYPLKYLHLNRPRKVIGINIMMFLIVLLSVGFNRDYFFTEPVVVLYIAIACVFRTFVVSIILMHVLKRANVNRERSFVYIGMSVWKNSGLASTLCIMLLADTPEAVLPCVISLLIETIWFGAMGGYFEKKWPAELGPNDPKPLSKA
jgi:BASS family bile acid:Na+ symporter